MRQAALQAGARGYVAKSDPVRDLLAAIEAVSQHLAAVQPCAGDSFFNVGSRFTPAMAVR